MTNLYYIAPILPEDSPFWGVVMADFNSKITNVDNTKTLGKISVEFSDAYRSGEGFAGLTRQQIDDFITLNGIQILTHSEMLSETKRAEWIKPPPVFSAL